MTPTGHRLQDLARRDFEDSIDRGLVSLDPAGAYVMPPRTAAAARSFLQGIEKADPTGRKRLEGEFSQVFRQEGRRVVPATPMYYSKGDEAVEPQVPPGSFLLIHSHPLPHGSGRNDFPSPADFLAAYDTQKVHGHEHEMLYHAPSDTFYSFSGNFHPPRFLKAVFPEPVRPPQPAPPPRFRNARMPPAAGPV